MNILINQKHNVCFVLLVEEFIIQATTLSNSYKTLEDLKEYDEQLVDSLLNLFLIHN